MQPREVTDESSLATRTHATGASAFGRRDSPSVCPKWVVQRRPIVRSRAACVAERSFESAPTAMDRMAAVGRRPVGGQGRPQAVMDEGLLSARRAGASAPCEVPFRGVRGGLARHGPETCHAQSDGVSIAYETSGHRPNEMVLVPKLGLEPRQPLGAAGCRELLPAAGLVVAADPVRKPYLDAGETAARTRVDVGHLDATQMGNRWLRIPRCVKSSAVTFVSRRAQPMVSTRSAEASRSALPRARSVFQTTRCKP